MITEKNNKVKRYALSEPPNRDTMQTDTTQTDTMQTDATQTDTMQTDATQTDTTQTDTMQMKRGYAGLPDKKPGTVNVHELI